MQQLSDQGCDIAPSGNAGGAVKVQASKEQRKELGNIMARAKAQALHVEPAESGDIFHRIVIESLTCSSILQSTHFDLDFFRSLLANAIESEIEQY